MRIISFGALAAIVAGGTVVLAQPAPGGARPDRAAEWQAHKAEFDAMKKHRADDIALLIGLRADQRPAFDAMMAAMEPPHHGPGERGPGKGGPGEGASDESLTARLDHMSARIDERGAAEKARLNALKAFYTSLTPDQRLRFDALDRLRHDHRPMGGHGFGGHGHGGPGTPPMG
ncbi:MAG TPA: Spy/CpxP family protein refolding chaperone [Sphingomonas sp.]